MMSLMASFCAVFIPRDVLDEIWDLIESVNEDFSTYSFILLLEDFSKIQLYKKA